MLYTRFTGDLHCNRLIVTLLASEENGHVDDDVTRLRQCYTNRNLRCAWTRWRPPGAASITPQRRRSATRKSTRLYTGSKRHVKQPGEIIPTLN